MTAHPGPDLDPLDVPRCPVHPLTELVVLGDAADGHDARWACPVEGCTVARIA